MARPSSRGAKKLCKHQTFFNSIQNKMRTQKHDLKDEILNLEHKLQKAIFDKDLFEQRAILIDLDNAKSTLINIR